MSDDDVKALIDTADELSEDNAPDEMEVLGALQTAREFFVNNDMVKVAEFLNIPIETMTLLVSYLEPDDEEIYAEEEHEANK